MAEQGQREDAARSYLDEDALKIPGQAFVALSFVGPRMAQKGDSFAVKIRGVFETRAQAEEHCQRLVSIDSTFDIYVADMYRWLHPPEPTDVADAVYQDQFLNELIAGHKESQARAKEYFEKRVREEAAAAMAAREGTSASAAAPVDEGGAHEPEESSLDAKLGLNDAPNVAPSKSWADEVEDEEVAAKASGATAAK